MNAATQETGPALEGVLPVDKPAGMTSHDVVSRIRKISGIRRVGHAGTLDPDATGVLVVCLGAATRLSDLLADGGKRYVCGLTLGITTSTEDASGTELTVRDASSVTELALREVIPRFLGNNLQIPPMVSAVHHEGKRLYELAREGITVDRQPRRISVTALTLETFTAGNPARATLAIACGKGTYVRTLCADIGEALGCGGHMSWLQRTAVGNITIANCVPLGNLTRENVASYLLSTASAVSDLRRIDVDRSESVDLAHGRSVRRQNLGVNALVAGPVAAVDNDGRCDWDAV